MQLKLTVWNASAILWFICNHKHLVLSKVLHWLNAFIILNKGIYDKTVNFWQFFIPAPVCAAILFFFFLNRNPRHTFL